MQALTALANGTTRTEIPHDLMLALVRSTYRLQYTRPTSVYYLVWLYGQEGCCGVWGDGANGSYEWFVFRDKELKTSDCGYGGAMIALRDVLNIVEPSDAHEKLLEACKLLTAGLTAIFGRCSTPTTDEQRAAITECQRILSLSREAISKAEAGS